MDGKMIFVLLLSGYISREPVATQSTEIPVTSNSPKETSTTSAITSRASLTPEHIIVETTTRGYIFTKAVATPTPQISGTLRSAAEISATIAGPAVYTPPGGRKLVLKHNLSQPVMVIIILAVIAVITGIIVGGAGLISLLKKRFQGQTSAPKTSEQTEEIGDSAAL